MADAAYIAGLERLRTRVLANLEHAEAAHGPDFSINGRIVNKQSYIDALWSRLDRIEQRLHIADGPFIHRSYTDTR